MIANSQLLLETVFCSGSCWTCSSGWQCLFSVHSIHYSTAFWIPLQLLRSQRSSSDYCLNWNLSFLQLLLRFCLCFWCSAVWLPCGFLKTALLMYRSSEQFGRFWHMCIPMETSPPADNEYIHHRPSFPRVPLYVFTGSVSCPMPWSQATTGLLSFNID